MGTESGSGIAHPARAALEEPPNEINYRLCSAQLSVLLPWIETLRHELVAANLYEVKRQMTHIGKDLTALSEQIGLSHRARSLSVQECKTSFDISTVRPRSSGSL